MHEFLVTFLASGVSVQDNSVKIAIITTVGVVIAAIITALATSLQRRRAEDGSFETARNFTKELIRRAETAERLVTRLNKRVDHLERICWQAGIDPDVADRPREGELDGAPPAA